MYCEHINTHLAIRISKVALPMISSLAMVKCDALCVRGMLRWGWVGCQTSESNITLARAKHVSSLSKRITNWRQPNGCSLPSSLSSPNAQRILSCPWFPSRTMWLHMSSTQPLLLLMLPCCLLYAIHLSILYSVIWKRQSTTYPALIPIQPR